MKKALLTIGLSFSLTGCIMIPGNIIGSVMDISDSIKARAYSVTSSNIPFYYVNAEQKTLESRNGFYLIQKEKSDKFIAFVASEHDEKNCFIGITITAKNADNDIANLQQFISWSKLSVADREQNKEQINQVLKNTQDNLSAINYSIDNQPLLTYSGKNCDVFSKEKHYAVTPDSIEKIISVAKGWQLSIKNPSSN